MFEQDKLVLTLNINIIKSHLVETEKKTVQQILFDGDAAGEYFNGSVLEGGVDTQEYYPDGRGTLSAKYCLSGKDCAGNDCKMYICNEGVSGEDFTIPQILTDSRELAWMNEYDFVGRLIILEEGVKIEIYKKA